MNNRNQEIKLLIILILVIITIIITTFEIFSLATYKEDTIADVAENKIVPNINISSNVIENNITKENIVKENTTDEKTTKTNKKSNVTKKNNSIGLINIPSLNIKYDILPKTSAELLKISINKYWGANPNEIGNMCLVGHNYKNSKFFGNLPKIKIGAKVYITDLKERTLEYKVYKTDVISDDDLECTSQITNGKREVTLITCYYAKGERHASKRFIAKARYE